MTLPMAGQGPGPQPAGRNHGPLWPFVVVGASAHKRMWTLA